MKLRTEAAMAEWNERVLAERRAEAQATRRRADPGPEPRYPHWTEQRTWSGETLYRPGTERNEWVASQYNPTDALKD